MAPGAGKNDAPAQPARGRQKAAAKKKVKKDEKDVSASRRVSVETYRSQRIMADFVDSDINFKCILCFS